MADPVIASRTPFAIAVEVGKSYWWCSCGKSRKQPLCDGSHIGGPFMPVEYKAGATATAWLCGCKPSTRAPLRDGTHKQL